MLSYVCARKVVFKIDQRVRRQEKSDIVHHRLGLVGSLVYDICQYNRILHLEW